MRHTCSYPFSFKCTLFAVFRDQINRRREHEFRGRALRSKLSQRDEMMQRFTLIKIQVRAGHPEPGRTHALENLQSARAITFA